MSRDADWHVCTERHDPVSGTPVRFAIMVRSLAEAEVVINDQRRQSGFIRAHVLDGADAVREWRAIQA